MLIFSPDFLESVVEGEPRPRFKRKSLSDVEVKEMMRRMPKLHKNNENFFRGNVGYSVDHPRKIPESISIIIGNLQPVLHRDTTTNTKKDS